jgi:hypothetical protein
VAGTKCPSITLPDCAELTAGALQLLGFGFWRPAQAGRHFFLHGPRLGSTPTSAALMKQNVSFTLPRNATYRSRNAAVSSLTTRSSLNEDLYNTKEHLRNFLAIICCQRAAKELGLARRKIFQTWVASWWSWAGTPQGCSFCYR